MHWMFIGYLLGATVTSSHDTREACEGRAVLLHERGVNGRCQKIYEENAWGSGIILNGTTNYGTEFTSGSFGGR